MGTTAGFPRQGKKYTATEKIVDGNRYAPYYVPLMGNRNDAYIAELEPGTQIKIRQLLTAIETEYGIQARIVSGRRTNEQQEKLYAIGRTANPIGDEYIVTNAKTVDTTFHGTCRAVDMYPEIEGKVTDNKATNEYWWNKMADLAERFGLVSGRTFRLGPQKKPDLPHYENQFCETCTVSHPKAIAFNLDGTCKTRT